MPNYDLNRLGSSEFERLSQSLLKEIIGDGTITFGEGKDGGREATFIGKAPYPSTEEIWKGIWIFQAKFHDILTIGTEKARQEVIADLKSELDKIVNKYKRPCDNYILITNVPLSSVHNSGTHDKIEQEVIPKFIGDVPHIHVWGADDIHRFLEKYPKVRQAYLHFITPGDLIADLMQYKTTKTNRIVKAIYHYMTTCFNREKHAQLDQAGQVEEKRTPLQDIFIDLDIQFVRNKELHHHMRKNASAFEKYIKSNTEEYKYISATRFLLSEDFSKTVLIGGPGEGKSTIGQFLAQLHRATLLHRQQELNEDELNTTVLIARIPFRIILKDFAQWLIRANKNDALEIFLSEKVQELSQNNISSEDIQNIFQDNPCLLILDGLDEVTDLKLQEKMLDRISEFLARCERILEADLQVLATSRPTSYSNQFEPIDFIHIQLVKLQPEKVIKYVNNWILAKDIEDTTAQILIDTINKCLDDHQISFLMNTPLQVTILIFIILSGGFPPRQREALFNDYLEVIYKRENAKAIIQTSKQELLELHEYLGYLMHKRSSKAQNVQSLLERSEFKKEVKRFLRSNDPHTPSKTLNEKVESIVRESEQRLVLIVEPELNYFGFELRSIQEFFAAAHLANAPKKEDGDLRNARFEAIAGFSHWRNVALFFAGRIGRLHSAQAANIITVCRHLDSQKPDIFLRRGANLSLELAADRSFGHKRGLQWNILEYGLTLLNEDTDLATTEAITNTLKTLPKEDIEDLVIPIIRNKLDYCSNKLLKSCLEICYALDPSNNIILETLENLINSSEQENVTYAIKMCLEFKISENWLRLQVETHLPSLPPLLFAEIFARPLINNPKYIRACLSTSHLSTQHIIELLNQMLNLEMSLRHRTRPRLLPDDDYSLKRLIENISSMEEVDQPFYINNIIITIQNNHKESHKKEDIHIFQDISMILANQQINLLPHLRACLWLFMLTEGPNYIQNTETLVSFFCLLDQYEAVQKFLQTFGLLYNQLIYAFLKAIYYKSDKDINAMLRLLKNNAEKKIDFRHLAIVSVEHLTSKERILATTVGLSAILDSSRKEQAEENFKSLLGVDPKYFSTLFASQSARLPNDYPIDSDLLENALDQIHKCILSGTFYTNELQRQMRSIFQAQWMNEKRIVDAATSLLNHLLTRNEVEFSGLESSIFTLFLKLCSFNPPSENMKELVIRRAANCKLKSVNLIIKTAQADNVSVLLTDWLKEFSNNDEEIQKGIIRFTSGSSRN